MNKTATVIHIKKPGDTIDGLSQHIDALVNDAKRALRAGVPKNQQSADRVSDLVSRLTAAWNKASAACKAERKPHLDAAKMVSSRWAPLLAAAEVYKVLKHKLLTPFLEAQAEEFEEFEEEGEPIPERPRPGAGTIGRTVALRTYKYAVIVDRSKVLTFFATSPAITEVLQELADDAVRSGIKVPGVRVEETKEAV